jgi:hypothetical protein
MQLPPWCRAAFHRAKSRISSGRRVRWPQRFRPQVELLENRLVPNGTTLTPVDQLNYWDFPNLTPDQIPLLTPAQIATIPDTTAFVQWSPEDRAALRGDNPPQIEALNTSLIAISLLTPGQREFLTAAQVQELPVDQFQYLPADKIPLLTPTQIGLITDTPTFTQIPEADRAMLQGLNPPQIEALNTAVVHISLLTPDQREFLTPAQVQQLPVDQFQYLPADKIPLLTPTQIGLITDTPTFTQIPDADRAMLQGLNPPQIEALNTALVHISLLTPDQREFLTDSQVQELPVDQFQYLPVNKIHLLTTDQIHSIPNTPTFALMSDAQRAQLRAQQVQALNTAAIDISLLTLDQIGELTPEQLAAAFASHPPQITITDSTGTASPPTSVDEGQTVSLGSTVTNGNIFHNQLTYQWLVRRNGVPLNTGTPTNQSSFTFTVPDDGVYAVTVTVDGFLSATTTIIGRNVVPVVDVGSTGLVTGPNVTFARTIGFTDPGTDTWTVSVNYGDGTSESFLLTPGDHGYDPVAKTFVLQHSYPKVATFDVTVTVSDGESTSAPGLFPVTVLTPGEAAHVVSFAIGVVDSSGTAHTELTEQDGSIHLGATITNGQAGDTVSLTAYDGKPDPDRINDQGQDASTGTIPTNSGGATSGSALPIAFVDTRATVNPDATVTLTYDFVVPDDLANTNLQLFWWNKRLKVWDTVSDQSSNSTKPEITQILDANGRPTGLSHVRFSVTYGPNTNPSLADLNGTVFSIAVPISGGGSSSAVIFPDTSVASNGGLAGGVEVRTTGFGSGSSLTLSVNESQTSQALTNSGYSRDVVGGVGENETQVADAGDWDLMRRIFNGDFWRELYSTEPTPAPPTQNAPLPEQKLQVSAVPETKVAEGDNAIITLEKYLAPRSQQAVMEYLPEAAISLAAAMEAPAAVHPALAMGAVLAGAAVVSPRLERKRRTAKLRATELAGW